MNEIEAIQDAEFDYDITALVAKDGRTWDIFALRDTLLRALDEVNVENFHLAEALEHIEATMIKPLQEQLQAERQIVMNQAFQILYLLVEWVKNRQAREELEKKLVTWSKIYPDTLPPSE
ncbi:MAG: hypothetical protein AMJ70_08525 [Dehalococcoidia bacterium SG8_51_3]|nr:MAG: hypothetical protein AMJ70_08525 [Dehalococcoidia bacterium SG8_51_3]